MSTEIDTMEDRARRADKIIRDPSNYKICEGCDSIVASKVVTCPNCHSYRFEVSAERIMNQARELGRREQHSVLASDLQ